MCVCVYTNICIFGVRAPLATLPTALPSAGVGGVLREAGGGGAGAGEGGGGRGGEGGEG